MPFNFGKVPLELWLKIFALRPGISLRKLAATFRIRLPESEERYSKVWDAVFKDYRWLDEMADFGHNCMLIGHDLRLLYRSNSSRDLCEALKERDAAFHDNFHGYGSHPRKVYLVLVAGPRWSPMDTDEFKKMLASLKVGTFGYSIDDKQNPAEITIPYGHDVEIILSISPIKPVYRSHEFTLDDPGNRLFAINAFGGLNSAYMYWRHDKRELRNLGPEDIVGFGKYASQCNSIKRVKEFCGLTVQRPQHNSRGTAADYPYQMSFHHPGGLIKHRRKYEDGNKESRHFIGWEYDSADPYWIGHNRRHWDLCDKNPGN